MISDSDNGRVELPGKGRRQCRHSGSWSAHVNLIPLIVLGYVDH
jgi:hypothetical protein